MVLWKGPVRVRLEIEVIAPRPSLGETALEARRKYLILACLVLVLLGTTGIALRLRAMKAAPPAPEETHWRIAYSIKFRTKGVSARCRVFIPPGTPEFRITRESISHSDLDFEIKQDQDTLEREALLIAPPGMDVLEKRLRGRGTENEEQLEKRISHAKWELDQEKYYDRTVINDELDGAVKEIGEIVADRLSGV